MGDLDFLLVVEHLQHLGIVLGIDHHGPFQGEELEIPPAAMHEPSLGSPAFTRRSEEPH